MNFYWILVATNHLEEKREVHVNVTFDPEPRKLDFSFVERFSMSLLVHISFFFPACVLQWFLYRGRLLLVIVVEFQEFYIVAEEGGIM